MLPSRLQDDATELYVHCQGSDVRPGVPWAPSLLRGRRGTMCIAKGSDVRPGVPWAPPLLRGRRGTMCIAKGSDVRPGVPRAPPRKYMHNAAEEAQQMKRPNIGRRRVNSQW